MLVLRAFKIYAKAASLQRLRSAIRSGLINALNQGIRQKLIVAEREHGGSDKQKLIVRIPNTPPIVVRKRGSRDFSEIPPSEIAEVMQLKRGSESTLGFDVLARAVLDHYGLIRMTARVEKELHRIYRKRFEAADSG